MSAPPHSTRSHPLAIYAPDETVVLAAVLGRHGHIELCIASDTEAVPFTVVDHLNDICTRLLSIHAAVDASPNQAAILATISQGPHIVTGSSEPALAALRLLELDLYTYCSARTRARIADAPFDWLNSLSRLVSCIQGAFADTRDDVSEGELGYLQRSVQVQRCLLRLEREISCLQHFMSAGPDADVDATRPRQASISLTVDFHLLAAAMPQFDRSIYSAYITRTTGTPPSEPPRAPKWMENVAYVNTAF